MRAYLSPAWNVVKIWTRWEPGSVTVPCPEPLCRAVISVALSWGWVMFARYVALTFCCLHRGTGSRGLKRKTSVLPHDMLEYVPSLFFRLDAPKTAWRGPIIQTSELDNPEIVSFVLPGIAPLNDEDRVFPFSSAQVRERWGRILDALEIDKRLIPIRSLRGGGTLWLYRLTRDIPLVYWRGR